MINVPALGYLEVTIIRAVGIAVGKAYIHGHLLSKSFDFSWGDRATIQWQGGLW